MEDKLRYYILHPYLDGYWPQHCLDNIAEYLSWYFDAPIYREEQKDAGTAIVLGAHYLGYAPQGSIIFNTEQVNASGSITSKWYEHRRIFRSMDYDSRHKHGYTLDEDFITVPIGYCPVWQAGFDKWKNAQKDVDVLMYGSMNPRRQYVLQYLQKRGIKVRSMTNLFGEQLIEHISRARNVLHVHYYPEGYHAPFRTVYAAHGTNVISEWDDAVPVDMPTFKYGDLDALVDMIKSGATRYVPEVVAKRAQ